LDILHIKGIIDYYNIDLLSLYLPDGSLVIVFLSVFAMHNDDSIFKIASPVFLFLIDSPASGILNYIHQVTSK
jgi:hypothetical protein